MNRTTSLKQTSFKNLLRNTGCVALAVALNAGAACALASFDTKGERHLAQAASRGAQRTYVVYLGERPAVNVCARKV